MKSDHDWQKTCVGDVAKTILTGRTPRKDETEIWDGDYPWVSVPDLNGWKVTKTEKTVAADMKEDSLRTVPPETILVSTRGIVGRTGITTQEVAISQDIKAIIPDRNTIDPYYLLCMLTARQPFLQNLATGSVPGVTTEELERTTFPLPPDHVQQQIASILTALLTLEEASSDMQAEQRHLKRVAMQEVFHEGLDTTDWHDDGRYGTVPTHWDVSELAEVAEITTGKSPTSDALNETEDGIPFVQDDSVFGPKYPRNERWCDDPEIVVDQGSVLVSSRGNGVGAVNIANRPLAIGRGIMAVRSEDVSPAFLYHYLQHKEERLQSLSQGASVNSLRKQELSVLSVPVPPKEEQERIVDILDSIDRLISHEETYQQAVEELRTVMGDAVIQNELQVPETLEPEIHRVNGND